MPIAGGIYFAFHEGGTRIAPAVVLLHAAGGSSLWWPAALRRLPGLRVAAPDLPGHGKSGGAGQQSTAAYADLIIELLTQIGIARAVFVGHDLGGCIALQLAVQRPDLIAGLALVSTGAAIVLPPGLVEDTASPLTFSRALPVLRDLCFSPTAAPELIDETITQVGESRQSVLHGDLLAMQAFDLIERLAEISAPTLVVAGKDDRLTPPSYAHALAGNIRNATLAVIPEAGHMLPLEKPAALRQSLLEWMRKLNG
jgi:pimeloyl-ACP methyl ester carboxylesterase